MSKYNEKLKLKVVKYVVEGNHSTHEATRRFSVDNYTVQKWVNKYLKHGATGLMRNYQRYDGKFKIHVVEYMHSNHLSLMETCIQFNLGNHDIVGKWERIYYEEGPQALHLERRGRSKNMSPRKNKLSDQTEKDLVEEVQQLRMENAYLKKLQALVQERVKRENPKKHKSSKN